MSSIFQRPELAESMANQRLNPGVLDEGFALRLVSIWSAPHRQNDVSEE
ncbi:hypothetical protein QE391_004189 [Pseudomonas fluorescens]|nr:hypothetical protein [Pseudomonas fluorescens]